MKKIYSLIFATALTLFSVNANAVNIPVSITNFAFTPATFTANVGDVVVWTLTSGTHTVVGTSVPSTAAAISSGTMALNGTYSYTITVAGTYTFKCGIHSSMVGGFSAAGSTGILEPATNLLTNAYPNPFSDKITVTYTNNIQSLEIINLIGEKVRTMELSAIENKAEIDLSNLPSGIYFYRTYKEGKVVETKKIVKAK
jgi:plastocyanin